jgi:AsmA protein
MSVDELEAMLPALGIVLPSGSNLKGGTLSTD